MCTGYTWGMGQGAKKNGRIADAWVVRTFLANPHVTGRALAETFHLAAGTDATVVGRTSIKKIKDTWVEMYKEMAFNNLAAVFASHWRRMNDKGGRHSLFSTGFMCRTKRI